MEAAFDNISREAIAKFLNEHLADKDVPYEWRFLLMILQEKRLNGDCAGWRGCRRQVQQGDSPRISRVS